MSRRVVIDITKADGIADVPKVYRSKSTGPHVDRVKTLIEYFLERPFSTARGTNCSGTSSEKDTCWPR